MLESKGILTGRVILDGIPMTYYGISITDTTLDAFGGRPVEIRCDDGRFSVSAKAGISRISIMGPGTRRLVLDSIVVPSGGVVDLGDLEMRHGDNIRGHVLDQLGAPVSDAIVTIGLPVFADLPPLQASFSAYYETKTSVSGVYVFDGVDPRMGNVATPLLRATHSHYGASLIRLLPNGSSVIDLVLLGVGEIRGKVHGFSGGPALAYAKRLGELGEPAFARSTGISRRGEFHFRGVPAGEYQIVAGTPARVSVTRANVKVAPDGCASADLTMNTVCAQVIVRVRPGDAKKLTFSTIASNDSAVAAPVRPSAVLTQLNSEHCYFNFVVEGSYWLSIDAIHWQPITVTALPSQQEFSFEYSDKS